MKKSKKLAKFFEGYLEGIKGGLGGKIIGTDCYIRPKAVTLRLLKSCEVKV
jgi:hypothetical protein